MAKFLVLTFHIKRPFVLPETMYCTKSGNMKNRVINNGQIPKPEKSSSKSGTMKNRAINSAQIPKSKESSSKSGSFTADNT